MPLQRCQSEDQPGWKWGDAGKCYVYTAGNEDSETAARKKAMAQAAAMGEFPGTGTGGRSTDDSGSSLGTQFRSFAPDLEVRSGGDGRTIFGIVVPYDAPTRIDDNLVESFARGAFNHQLKEPHRVKFAREHVMLGGELIGVTQALRDDAAGLYAEMRASKTPEGDRTLELVKDRALDQMSVAFRERQNRRLGGGIVQRVKADLFEIAVVMQGAYGELAAVAGVRSRQIPEAAMDLDLRAAADEYLHGLPKPTDHDLEIRKIRLGMPY